MKITVIGAGYVGLTTGACLADTQLRALERAFGGPRNSRGDALYSDWPFDPGIATPAWRSWKIESTVGAWDRVYSPIGYQLYLTYLKLRGASLG